MVLQIFCQQAGQRMDRADGGCGRLGDEAKFHHRADQRLQFKRAAHLNVLQHRGFVLAHGLRAGDAFVQADLELHAELFADGLRLAHHAGGQLARGGEQADVFQRGMRQRADRVEAQVAPDLEPDFGADVHRYRCLETSRLESVADGPDAGCVSAVKLAQREAVAFDDLDDARADYLTGRVHHAADHAVNADVLGDGAIRVDGVDGCAKVAWVHRCGQLLEVPPGYAVLHGDHAGVGMHQRGQLSRNGRHLVGFHAQDDDILNAGLGNGGRGANRVGQHLVAVLLDQ